MTIVKPFESLAQTDPQKLSPQTRLGGIFQPGEQPAKRDIFQGIIEGLESTSPKENLKVLSVIQNLNILGIRSEKDTDGIAKEKGPFDRISAPIPGMDTELQIKELLENGTVKPSSSMLDLAGRHGLEIPGLKDNTWTKESGKPEFLTLDSPAKNTSLANPGLREITGTLVAAAEKTDMLKAFALDKLIEGTMAILTQDEKNITEPEKDDPMSPIPWGKGPKKKAKAPENAIEDFNDAGEALAKLTKKQRGDVFDKWMATILDSNGHKRGTAQHAMGYAKEGLAFVKEAFSNNPDKIGAMATHAGKALGHGLMAASHGAKALLAPNPVTLPLLIAALVIKQVVGMMLEDQKGGPEQPTPGEEKPKGKEASKDGESPDKNPQTPGGSILDNAIQTVLPSAGGAKGLAKKGILKGTAFLGEKGVENSVQELKGTKPSRKPTELDAQFEELGRA